MFKKTKIWLSIWQKKSGSQIGKKHNLVPPFSLIMYVYFRKSCRVENCSRPAVAAKKLSISHFCQNSGFFIFFLICAYPKIHWKLAFFSSHPKTQKLSPRASKGSILYDFGYFWSSISLQISWPTRTSNFATSITRKRCLCLSGPLVFGSNFHHNSKLVLEPFLVVTCSYFMLICFRKLSFFDCILDPSLHPDTFRSSRGRPEKANRHMPVRGGIFCPARPCEEPYFVQYWILLYLRARSARGYQKGVRSPGTYVRASGQDFC